MPESQLQLLPAVKPLLERFGHDFFRLVPGAPGVYVMTGEDGLVLYVGQSGHLRHRLNQYKNLQPDRAPRKLVRLAVAVREITWEVTPSAAAARLRENELLRKHKPRFNRINTRPEIYCYLDLEKATDSEAVLRFTMDAATAPQGERFGAFKSPGSARWLLATLQRLAWIGSHPGVDLARAPLEITARKSPVECRLKLGPDGSTTSHDGVPWRLLRGFFTGESNGLVEWFRTRTEPFAALGKFQADMLAGELEMLSGFFRHGPRRNRGLQETFTLGATHVGQAQLDDLLVLTSVRAAQEFEPME